MTTIKEQYHKIHFNLNHLTEMKYFDECFAGIMMIISLLGWKYSNLVGMSLLIGISSILLLFLNDLKYVIPGLIYFIFTMGKGFANDEFPIPIIIVGSVFVLVIVISIFRNRFHFKKLKSFYGFLGLAIMNVVPIFWCNTIEVGHEVFYFLFFANIGYLILYMLIANGIQKESIHLLAVTMSLLGILMAGECAFKVYELKDSVGSIFELVYYLGWGVCNEAGIMTCFSIPFTFYLLGKTPSVKGFLGWGMVLVISLIGLLLTTSRGAYLCGFAEVFILAIVVLFYAKRPKLYQTCFFATCLVAILFAIIFKDNVIQGIEMIIDTVFYKGLDDSGRKEIWDKGYELWNQNFLSRLLGPGICSEIREMTSSNGWQKVPLVFHSTFWQTLVMGGIFGLLFLAVHLAQKYWHLFKCDRLLFVTLGIGYFMIDMYGMIDNTYHMYYFMIPLVVIMACVDRGLDEKPFDIASVL